jgi:hypothetical protein
MGTKHDTERRPQEARTFETERAIDVQDETAVRFWTERFGVSREELIEVVKEVGPNATAVALKIEAPSRARVAPSANPQP